MRSEEMYCMMSSPNGGADGDDPPISPLQWGCIFRHRHLEQMRQRLNSGSTRLLRCGFRPLMEVPRMSFQPLPLLIVQHQQEGGGGGGAQGAIEREVYRIKTKSKTDSKEDSKKKKKQEKDNINGDGGDKEAEEEDDNRCAVCLDKLKDGVVVGRLPCDHVFHEKCITPWLSSHHVCPVCRCNLLPNSSPAAFPSSLADDGHPVSPPPPPPPPPRACCRRRPHSHDQDACIHIEFIHSPPRPPPPRGHHYAYPG